MTLRVAMLSPYALTRPGGVQGQVVGLSRALRELGHDVTVVAPADPDRPFPAEAGEHYVIGRPTDLHSNGSVAPVAFWPGPVARAERFIRKGGFDVAHIHEPLAPMAAYGLVLTAPLPMVGTYHRAGVSRWVPVLKPLAELVGRRMQVRVAVSDAARETGKDSSGGHFEVLFNGVDMERFESATPVHDDHDPPRPTVLFLGRHEQRKGLGVLLDAFAMIERPAVLWVAGEGPGTEVQRRRHPESDRVRWLGTLCDQEVAERLAGADVLCAPSLHGESFGMVVLEGMAAGCAVVASDIEGYRKAAAGHAALVPPGDKDALARALGVTLADAVEGSGQSATDARKAAREHARNWSMDMLAERYVGLYERALREYRGRARP
ncbi:MAG TPA: glycosyltransferase family 4 protein [Acidimicrobiales bacterium]|nr:glycosyltransferase family 4 protein [Acidimicrobiales bacterium]